MSDGTTDREEEMARKFMWAALSGSVAQPPAVVRPVRDDEVEALGSLMYRAYFGTIDYDGETEEQATAEIAKTIAGEYGVFDRESSRVCEHEGRIASAALVTRWEGRPFVAFTMTRPELKKQGYGRACMAGAMRALSSRGEDKLRLLVTVANLPAVALYESLGFAFEE